MMMETVIEENDPLYDYLKKSPMATKSDQTFELTIINKEHDCEQINVKSKIMEWEQKKNLQVN
jgi:hypothetical protein